MSPGRSLNTEGQRMPLGVALAALMAASAIIILAPSVSPLFIAISLALLLKRSGCWMAFPGRSVPWSDPSTWMAALFVMYVIGLAWSSNMEYATFDLEVKASMLLIPLALCFIPKEQRTGGGMMLLAFRTAAAVAALICTVVAFGSYGLHWWQHWSGRRPDHATTGVLISTNFSLFMHPSYFAMYLCLALASLELGPEQRRWPWERWIGPLLVIGILLSASKAGWLALLLYGCVTIAINWRDVAFRRRRLMQGAAAAFTLGILTLLSPFFREKVDQFSNALRGGPVDVSARTSTESRELIWSAAIPLIAEHMPWGTGTGDVKDALVERYTDSGYLYAATARLNAHSQLLQTPLTLGLPGMLLLYGLLLVPGLYAIARKDGLMVVFLLLLLLNWAVESMLETQAGVLFLSWGALMLAMRSSPSVEANT